MYFERKRGNKGGIRNILLDRIWREGYKMAPFGSFFMMRVECLIHKITKIEIWDPKSPIIKLKPNTREKRHF